MKYLTLQLFKVKAWIEMPIYNEIVDAERLDNWLDQLETYVTIYGTLISSS